MKAIKRTVAALLATLMLATSTSFTLAAENYTDDEAVVVAKVNAAGIMTGTDKGFEPSKSLTRAEAAAIIVRMKGISESAVKTAAGTTLFKDVAAAHWASGYVNQASNLGIVKGVSATEFAPDREVTVAEFVTMAVRALGAGQLVDSEGVWPTNYVNFANENDLLKDVNAIYTATASRMNAATIVVNSLTAAMWEKSGVKSNGEIEWTKTTGTSEKTILKNVLKLTKIETYPVHVVSNNDHTVEFMVDPDHLPSPITKIYDVNDNFDLTSLRVGLTYEAYVDEDEEIQGMWLKNEDTVEFTAIADKFKNDKIKLTVNGSEKEYKVADGAKFFKNENSTGANISTISDKNKNAEGTAYINDDGKISSMYFTDYSVFAVVDEVTKSYVKMDSSVYGCTADQIKYVEEKDEFFFTKDGKAFDLANLKAGDAIEYYVVEDFDGTNDKFVGRVLTNDVEGKVTAKGSDYIKLDGTKYDVKVAKLPSIDTEIKAWFNHAGKIVLWEKIEGAASDVAMVKYAREVSPKYASATNDFEVELFYSDGTVSEKLIVDYEDTFDAYAENVTVEVDDAETPTEWTVNGEAKASAAAAKALINTNRAYYDEAKLLDTTAKYYFNDNGYTSKKAAGKKIADEVLANAKVVAGNAITCYEVNGSSLTLKPYSEDENKEYFELGITGGIVVNSNSAYVTGVELVDAEGDAYTGRAYINKNTSIFKIKTDDDYGVKFAQVNFDDLDSTDLDHDGFITDWDANSKTIGTIYLGIGTDVQAVSTGKYAYVEKISTTKYDGETAKEVEVIFLDGSKESYIATKDDTDGYSSLQAGMFGELTISGEVITEIGAGDIISLPITISDGHLDEYDASYNTIIVDGEEELTLSDKVLVLEQGTNKVTVRDIDDLTEYEAGESEYSKILELVVIQEDSDEEPVVVLVRYEDVD